MRESNAHVGRAVRSPREQHQRNSCDSDAAVGEAHSHWKVVVWESQTTRLKLIDRVVSDCGARACQVEELGDIEQAPCSSCCAAVVALGTCQTDETLASNVIGRMKQAGLTIIAHAQGVHSWPVGERSESYWQAQRVCSTAKNLVFRKSWSGF